ncbi:MAG: RNA-binding protein 26 [Paramarteilia canceri]
MDTLSSELKEEIGHLVAPHCASDPLTLANYISALLSKNRPVKELKELCNQKLKLFFYDNVDNIVDQIFELLYTKNIYKKDDDAQPKTNKKSQLTKYKKEEIQYDPQDPINFNDYDNLNSFDSYKDDNQDNGIKDIVWEQENDDKNNSENDDLWIDNDSEVKSDLPRSIGIISHKPRKQSFGIYDKQQNFAHKKSRNNRYEDNYNFNSNHLGRNSRHNPREVFPKYNIDECNALIVYNIPESLNTVEKLSKFFAHQGKVTKIITGINNDMTKALICFSNRDHALRVFRSPFPVLNNRFIKLRLTKQIEDDEEEKILSKNLKDLQNDAPDEEEYSLRKSKITEEIINKRNEEIKKLDTAMEVERQKLNLYHSMVKDEKLILEKLNDPSVSQEQKDQLFVSFNKLLVQIEKIRSQIVVNKNKKSNLNSGQSNNTKIVSKAKHMARNELKLDKRSKIVKMELNPDIKSQGKFQNSDILNFFKGFGKIENIKFTNFGTVFVKYLTRYGAEKAVSSAGFAFESNVIPISFSKSEEFDAVISEVIERDDDLVIQV